MSQNCLFYFKLVCLESLKALIKPCSIWCTESVLRIYPSPRGFYSTQKLWNLELTGGNIFCIVISTSCLFYRTPDDSLEGLVNLKPPIWKRICYPGIRTKCKCGLVWNQIKSNQNIRRSPQNHWVTPPQSRGWTTERSHWSSRVSPPSPPTSISVYSTITPHNQTKQEYYQLLIET